MAMTARTLWLVTTPDDDEITVIAETPEDACHIVAEYEDVIEYEANDDDDAVPPGYRATPIAAGQCWICTRTRWVGYESATDAANSICDLEAHGVTLDRIITRETSRPGLGIHLWEVGARDEDWCKLADGVLCGGGS